MTALHELMDTCLKSFIIMFILLRDFVQLTFELIKDRRVLARDSSLSWELFMTTKQWRELNPSPETS